MKTIKLKELSNATKKRNPHLFTSQAPNLERTACHEQVAKKKSPRFSTPVSIHIHSLRKRLADPDGVSAKAAVDGLVRGGILEDDNAQFVKEVSFSQEKRKEEQTIITVREI